MIGNVRRTEYPITGKARPVAVPSRATRGGSRKAAANGDQARPTEHPEQPPADGPVVAVRDERTPRRGRLLPVSYRIPDALVLTGRKRPYQAIARCVACHGPFAIPLGPGRPPLYCHWCARDSGEQRAAERQRRRRKRIADNRA